jgi:putative iron-regulated protein
MASAAGAADMPDPKAVLTTYADIALAMYSDSLVAAETLQKRIDALAANPSEATLDGARHAWLEARVPYQQTEAYRFGNAIVDDWEGRVNAWPLDEGLIDYVDASYGTESDENPLYVANVVANPKLHIGGAMVDASTIDKALLQDRLQEAGEVEANVATGYHAIEFLLWGQDLNGTGPGAGNRSHTDFDTKTCTHGNCDRRVAYLRTAAALLVDDLKEMVDNWGPRGPARKALTDGAPEAGLATILTGLGSLSYGEMAGERMKLGLLLHDPEEEHDCFSDNTYNSHFYDQVGMMSVYFGKYVGIDGRVVAGPSVAGLLAAKQPDLAAELDLRMLQTLAAMTAMKKTAEAGKAYDQMLAEGDDAGNAVVQAAIDGLVAQAKTLEQAVAALGLSPIAFEGSDSLDNPNAVFQ